MNSGFPARLEFDEIHRFYIRLTEISEYVRAHPRFSEVHCEPGIDELFHRLAALTNDVAGFKILTEDIKKLSPRLWEVWNDALHHHEPEPAG